jgi:triosephosphate isomerase
MRRKIVAGNWKMNPQPAEAALLIDAIVLEWRDDNPSNVQIIICPPSLYLQSLLNNQPPMSNLGVGAQNCYFEKNGAFTGEVSAIMLASMGVQYCLVGHSERRSMFGETDEWVNLKAKALVSSNVSPIICCGELLNERENNQQFEVVANQLKRALTGFSDKNMEKVIIAYEPVWAIGTGKTATSNQAQEMHAFIRNELKAHFGVQVANQTPILYGGSCKPDNAKELFACADVDGGLIGGASLNANDFLAIADAF